MSDSSCWPQEDGACCPLPPEFVRMRYFFGQRLGVVDFAEEQSYHAGKQRFHNLRAHGSGVLCGLRAERFVWPMGSAGPSTVLVVRRGAALDACGREVVVGGDQCIDVAAWFAKNRERFSDPPPAEAVLWVAVRYRECPSDPAPAPRDPCNCDTGGCEFGRVREGFQLEILTDDEANALGDGLFPDAAALRGLLDAAGAISPVGDGTPADRLTRALNLLLAGDCPAVPADAWILLASFTATIDTVAVPPVVTAITDPDNGVAERQSLLTTRALQELLSQVISASSSAGVLGEGPTAGEPTFEGIAGSAVSGTLVIPVTLVQEGLPAVPVPLAAGTFAATHVTVSRADPGPVWTDSTPPSMFRTYDPATNSFRIHWNGNPGAEQVVAGDYRVALAAPFATPIVDEGLRPLRPAQYARHFRLSVDAVTGALDLEVL